MLKDLLAKHVFVHDGWCECMEPTDDAIDSDQWAEHVAEIISMSLMEEMKKVWYGKAL